jgi:hypothetical protein
MEQKPTMPGLFSYDEVDAFVAAVFRRCEQLFSHSEKRAVEPTLFNDEWERQQMVHELQWN